MAGGEGLTATTTQPKLSKQDLSLLDVTKLTPLSPEVISNQATINIGTIGHVAHGKSTVVKALSGVQTVRFKNELERNITIKLGNQEQTETMDSIPTPEEAEDAVQSDLMPTETAGASGFPDFKNSSEEQTNKSSNPRKSKRKRKARKRETDEYEVECIVDYEYDGRHWYKIKWKGWKHKYNTWEPLENLTNSQKLVDEFHRKAEECEKAEKLKLEMFETEVTEYLTHCANKHFPREEMEKRIKATGSFPELPSQSDLERCYHLLKKNSSSKPGNSILRSWAIARAREAQLADLRDWEEKMNAQCTDTAPIFVENDVDLEISPKSFNYINAYLSSPLINIPTEPPVGCDCGEQCVGRHKGCCADQAGAIFAYTPNKRLKIKQGQPIYECNARCSCLRSCPNRVVQLGRQYPLSIFRTSNGCGWGVRTVKRIPRGTFICEYVGEVITNEEAEKRGREYDAQGRTYLFDLDYNQTEHFDCMYTVDAAMYGNLSHFINHSCDPNLEVFAVWIDCLDPNLPRLALFACKDINAGEEITFDYTPHHARGESVGHPSPSRHARKAQINAVGLRTRCKCGSAVCRKEFF